MNFLSTADAVGVADTINRIGHSILLAFFIGILVGLFVYTIRRRR